MTGSKLSRLTRTWTGRAKDVQWGDVSPDVEWIDDLARDVYRRAPTRGTLRDWNGLHEVYGNSSWPSQIEANALAFTFGHYIFYSSSVSYPPPNWLRSHEYVHVLQYEGKGAAIADYVFHGTGPNNPYEAIAYLWQGYTYAYRYGSYSSFLRPAP